MFSGISDYTILRNRLIFIQEIDYVYALSCDNKNITLCINEFMVHKPVEDVIETVPAKLYTGLDLGRSLPLAYCQQHVDSLLIA